MQHLNQQLHVALVSLCRDEALTVVRNSSKGQGLDSWRRLVKEYEPNTPQANLRMLKRVLQPTPQLLENLRSYMETWERETRIYQERTGERLSDPLRRLTLQSMCPTALQQHLEFHAARLNTYDALKSEIDSYLDIKLVASSGASPMDIDAVEQAKGKGTSKGKGKNKGKSITCRHCNRKITQTHTEWDCWYNPRNKSPEAVAKREAKGQGKGKQSSKNDGKGGGKRNDKGKGKPKGKNVHSLEEQSWPDELETNAPEPVGSLFALDESQSIAEPEARDDSGSSSSKPHTQNKMGSGPRNALTYLDGWQKQECIPSKTCSPKIEDQEDDSNDKVERIEPSQDDTDAREARDRTPKRAKVSKEAIVLLHFALESKLSEAAREADDNDFKKKCKEQMTQLKHKRLDVAKGTVNKMDARMQRDIEAGHSTYLARRKLASRIRAWVQTYITQGAIKVSKVHTTANPADILTKPVTWQQIQAALRHMRMYVS